MRTDEKVIKKAFDNTLVEKFMKEKRLEEAHQRKKLQKERNRKFEWLPQEFPPLPGPCCQAEAAQL